jgi:hypothetical protein
MRVERHSPSSLNLFAASPAMYTLERILGQKQPVGIPAHRGTAIEAGVAAGLLDPGLDLEACTSTALSSYDKLTAFSGDPRREAYRETLAPMVAMAIKALRPYGTLTGTQRFIEWRPEGLSAPIVGYLDFEWEQHGLLIDLKTTEKCPSAIKQTHARQVALYAMSDNLDGRLTYCTPKKCVTYQLENVALHRQALHRIAMAVERFLALSDDPQFFVGITAPDTESYFWKNPSARQIAYEIWGI